MSSRNECSLRFGELWVDDQRLFGRKGACNQCEGLGAPGRGQYLINSNAVGLGNGLSGCVGIGIPSEMLGGVADNCAEPVRRSGQAYVDRQVHESFREVAISVVVKVRSGEITPSDRLRAHNNHLRTHCVGPHCRRVVMDRMTESLRNLGISGPMQM